MPKSLRVRSEEQTAARPLGGGDGDKRVSDLLTAMRSTPQDLDCLHVVGRVEPQLPVVQAPFAPALLVLFTQFGQFITCRGRRKGESSQRVLEHLLALCFSPGWWCWGVPGLVLSTLVGRVERQWWLMCPSPPPLKVSPPLTLVWAQLCLCLSANSTF